jgi:hypothetical protein
MYLGFALVGGILRSLPFDDSKIASFTRIASLRTQRNLLAKVGTPSEFLLA